MEGSFRASHFLVSVAAILAIILMLNLSGFFRPWQTAAGEPLASTSGLSATTTADPRADVVALEARAAAAPRGEIHEGRFQEANAPRCAVIDFPRVPQGVTGQQVGRAAALAMARICSADPAERPNLLDDCVQDPSFGRLCYHAVLRR